MSAARNDALDGIRGCAVTAVLMYHAHYSWAQGGFLGVDMFFVLSGYLITRGLLRLLRADERGRPSAYMRFLARRAARLVPALLTALACAAVLTTLTGTRADRAQLGRCTAAAGGYAMNLPVVERLHCSAIWHITWSLASEEQFYLVWPLLLTAIITAAGRAGKSCRAAIVAVALGLFGASIVWQIPLRRSGASTSRVLFAPDGRSLVLLVGCALAAASLQRLTPKARSAAALAGALVLLVDLASASASPGYTTVLALLLSAIATAALIQGVTSPERNPVSRALASCVPATLGRLSYSLYLLHELAFRISDLVAQRGTVAYELIRWPLCLIAAVCSYRLVEQPCREKLNRRLDGGGLRHREGSVAAHRTAGLPAPQGRLRRRFAAGFARP